MKKKIKKYGDTLVISFSKEEQEIYNLHKDKIVEVLLGNKEVTK